MSQLVFALTENAINQEVELAVTRHSQTCRKQKLEGRLEFGLFNCWCLRHGWSHEGLHRLRTYGSRLTASPFTTLWSTVSCSGCLLKRMWSIAAYIWSLDPCCNAQELLLLALSYVAQASIFGTSYQGLMASTHRIVCLFCCSCGLVLDQICFSSNRQQISPPWDEDWKLDEDFFKDLVDWDKRHQDSAFLAVVEKIRDATITCKPFMELIPNEPFPARALVLALSHFLHLGIVRSHYPFFKSTHHLNSTW